MFATDLEFLLRSLGYEDLRATYERKHLLENAAQVNPEQLEAATQRNGKPRNWERTTSNRAIGLVYGFDYIIEIAPSHHRIGLNLLTSPDEVQNKVSQAENLISLWKSIGISQAIVLLAVYPDIEDQGLVFYDKHKSQDELYGRIMDGFDSHQDVSSAEVHIQVE
jgi:hypothetical protein